MRIVGGRSVGRGQAIQLGALLLFAILIINLSLFQVFVVPNQNAEIEFNHNQQVRDQMVDYRAAVLRASGGGTGQTVSVQLGPSYPSRTLFVNPGPPSGTLRSVGTDDESVNATLANVRALDPEARDFWDGTQRNYSTGAFQYRPGYNYYDEAPTSVYENTVMYDRFGDNQLNRTDQTLVSGRRISLVALQGSYSEAGSGAASVSAFPASGSDSRVTVENAPGENLSVAVPTRLGEEEWVSLLSGEIDPNAPTGSDDVSDATTCADLDGTTNPVDDDRYVVNCDYEPAGAGETFGTIRLWFEDGSYDVRLSKVTFGGDESTAFGYVTRVDGHNESVSERSTLQLVAETRDEFNNPSSGVDLIAETGSGTQGSVSPTDRVTDSGGRAAFTFEPEEDNDPNDEDVSVVVCRDIDDDGDCGDETPRNRSVFEIDVLDGDTAGGGGGGGQSPPSIDNFGTGQQGRSDTITVDADVSDPDGDLNQASVEITDSGGSTVANGTFTLSGSSDSISDQFSVPSDGTYDVALTVSDGNPSTGDASRTEEQTVG